MDTAFTAVIADNGSIVAQVVLGIKGYLPRPEYGTFPNHNDADAKAKELNAGINVSSMDAWLIVASSMRHQYSK